MCNDQFDQKASGIGHVLQSCFRTVDIENIRCKIFLVMFDFLLSNCQILTQLDQISRNTRTETVFFFRHHSAWAYLYRNLVSKFLDTEEQNTD